MFAKISLIFCITIFFSALALASSSESLLSFVDPLIGTGGTGYGIGWCGEGEEKEENYNFVFILAIIFFFNRIHPSWSTSPVRNGQAIS